MRGKSHGLLPPGTVYTNEARSLRDRKFWRPAHRSMTVLITTMAMKTLTNFPKELMADKMLNYFLERLLTFIPDLYSG